jgi:hypothetical protein
MHGFANPDRAPCVYYLAMDVPGDTGTTHRLAPPTAPNAGVKVGDSTSCPSCYADCGKRAITDHAGAYTIASLDPTGMA